MTRFSRIFPWVCGWKFRLVVGNTTLDRRHSISLYIVKLASMAKRYRSMDNAHEGMPLLREKGAVEVDEGRSCRRGRIGAAFGLVVLALGAISASSALLGGKTPSHGEYQLVGYLEVRNYRQNVSLCLRAPF